MNLLTAYVFFAIAFVIVGIPTTTVGSFTQGYPAELSGMQTGDKILMIDDTKIDQWEDISLALADANATQSLSVQVYRESTDEYLTFKIKPAYVEDEERYILGVQAATTKNIFKALANAGALVWTYIKLILSTFIGLIRGLVGIDAFTGPIGVVSIVSDMASYGVAAVFQIAAAISISLGIINMLPIPALDGSRVFLLLVEAIKGSPIKKERENVFHFIGFALMILLAIVIAYNDIIRFF
jgi:regulator of sigma E protease